MGLEDFILGDAERVENLRISSESKKYLHTSPSEWPFSSPVWDLTRAAQRYVTRERTEAAFRSMYPNGLLLALVDFDELDTELVSIFRRKPSELWTAHSNDNIAKIILHWSENTPLTPPMIRLFDEFGMNAVTINDGSHRLAVARALGVRKLHVLMDEYNFSKLIPKLSSLRLIDPIN